MKEDEEIPDEAKCFICLKKVTEETRKLLGLAITVDDALVVVTVAICNEDLSWVKGCPDGARAIVQSRLQAMQDRENAEGNDDRFGDGNP